MIKNIFMKKIFILLVLIFGIKTSTAQKNLVLEAEGNLESLNPCGCIELSEVTNKHNPADILHGMGKCIELNQFEKAARLFAVAGVYGRYDTYRVKDKSAHQALLVLQQDIILNVDENVKSKLVEILMKELEKGSNELNNICTSIQKIGMPKYYPKYMIQHGIQAFTENNDNGLVKEFDSEKSWDLALKEYLHCGE
jgi:hypothetical protein